jgi:hypothetical protein
MANKQRARRRRPGSSREKDRVGQLDLVTDDRRVRYGRQEIIATIPKTATLRLQIAVTPWHERRRVEIRQVGDVIAGSCSYTTEVITFDAEIVDDLIGALLCARDRARA